jgi:hypothetical protein
LVKTIIFGFLVFGDRISYLCSFAEKIQTDQLAKVEKSEWKGLKIRFL